MSVAVSHEPERRHRRVRQEARDALAVAAFSAGASTGLALLITLVVTRAG
ncbi:MAG: hypothetical protein QOK15_3858 [Nocardioidaceae bacterium]|jgi:hypothetical protein|nr:hypothetical protein [Nocardioidaceae bacterium]